MSISSTANRVVYTGNGSTTAFSFPYEFFATSDLVVLETVIATGVVTTKTLVTDYTVSGTPDASGIYPNGGTVTAVTAPASTVKWTIYRDVPATQTTVFVDNNKLSAASLNNALDKLTLLAQRTREIVLRCVRLADGDVSGADTTLPTPVASKLLGWAADGLSVVNYAIADLSSSIVTAYSSTQLALSSAAAWRTGLGFGTSLTSALTKQPTLTTLSSGTGTYTTPAGCTRIDVRCWGGGASGGGGDNSTHRGIGGGGGAYCRKMIVSPSATYSYAVAAGAGGVNNPSTGNAGASTTFSTLTAGGGTAGSAATGSGQSGVSGGTASGGDENISGGSSASNGDGTANYVSIGGDSPLGGRGGMLNVATNGFVPGGGGAAANISGISGTGAAGLILITEHYN